MIKTMSLGLGTAFGAVLQDQLEDPTEAKARDVLRALLRSVATTRHLATTLFRLAQVLGTKSSPLGHCVKQVNHVLTGADLAWQARVGAGLRLYHPTGVVIGPGVIIGRDLVCQQGVTIGGKGGANDGSPVIGQDVVLGAGSRLLGPIVIGDRARVGANAVVLIDVGPGLTATGVPARIRVETARELPPE